MDTLQALRAANPGLEILPVSDPAFERYGRVITGLDMTREVRYIQDHAQIGSAVVYEPTVPGLEAAGDLKPCLELQHYGAMPVQLGWCYGHNLNLDGLEYHKGSEIDVAVTDIAVMLAEYNDIHWDEQPWIDSAAVKTFYVPQGTAFELYAWGLHFAPLHVSEAAGFATLVALPDKTNFALEQKPEPKGEAALLFARNKWLLVHPEAQGLVRDGAFVGVRGENLKMKALP
jgi:hypothetical protein